MAVSHYGFGPSDDTHIFIEQPTGYPFGQMISRMDEDVVVYFESEVGLEIETFLTDIMNRCQESLAGSACDACQTERCKALRPKLASVFYE